MASLVYPSGSPKPVTIRDVAQAAGVSKTTASDALRGNHKVAEVTRNHVCSIAGKLGYSLSPSLSLAGANKFRRSGATFKLLGFSAGPENMKSPNFRAALSQRLNSEKARLMGFDLTLEIATSVTGVERLLKRAYRSGVDGIILGQWHLEEKPDALNLKLWAPFSLVSIAPSFLRYQRVDYLGRDIFDSFIHVWSKVREAGYRRTGVAMACHDPLLPGDHQRIGAAYAMLRQQEKQDYIPLLTFPFNEIAAQKQISRWCSKYHPEAVIGFSAATFWALPEPLPFAALNVSSKDKHSIAGIRQESDEITETVLKFMHDKILLRQRGFSDTGVELLLPSEWVDGDSLPHRQTHSLTPH